MTDGHHDVVGLLEADGSLVGTTVYDPYGEPSTQTGVTSRLGFQSDWTDPDTDHVWMGARWYQPSSATFLTRDTYQGELNSPFSLNRYTYANNNPNTYWDPTGHNACTRVEGYNPCKTKKKSRLASIPELIDAGYMIPRSGVNRTITRQTVAQTATATIRTVYHANNSSANSDREPPPTYQAPPVYQPPPPPEPSAAEQVMEEANNFDLADFSQGVLDYGLDGLKDIIDLGKMAWAGLKCGLSALTPWGDCDEVKALVDGAIALGQNVYNAVKSHNLGAVLDIISGFLPERCALNASFEFDYCAGYATAAIVAKVVTSGAGAATQLGLLEKVGDIAPSSVQNAVTNIRRHLPEDLPGGCNSFVPGTEVLMADGTTKPIEDIEIGELVWATNPETGESGPRPIIDTITGYGDKELVDIAVEGEIITATDEHPFWVSSRGVWVDAEDIRSGDLLLDEAGATLVVAAIGSRVETSQIVFNLSIDDLHTYYVGAGGAWILVHNDEHICGISDEAYNAIDRAHGPEIAYGVDYNFQRMCPRRECENTPEHIADHTITGIGHDPIALGDYFAADQRMTHRANVGSTTARRDDTLLDERGRGVTIVNNGYMIHGYHHSRSHFDNNFTEM